MGLAVYSREMKCMASRKCCFFILFLSSVSVCSWKFLNEISSVEAVDVFALFEWASDLENRLGIIDEGLVEDHF
jgi:hypothetical protein